jgi:hypothetical protein
MRRTTAQIALCLALLLLAPASAQALPRGFFGIVPQTSLSGEDTVRMRLGGIETIRIPIPWSSVQPSPNSGYHWSFVDSTMALAVRERLEVLPFLVSSPRWATGSPRRLPVANARQRQAWFEFVYAAVARYGRGGAFWDLHGPGSPDPLTPRPVRAWQIWNEENFFFFTRPASPGRYARLLKVSRRAVRQADPRADIILGGLFGNPRQRPPHAMDATAFLDRLYRVRGIKATFDGVALHPYAADTRELRSLVGRVRATMIRHRDRRAGLYLTEVGWGSQFNPRVVAFEVGRRGQARELRSSYRYLIANRKRLGLRQVDWFTWKDITGACAFCDSSGLFRRGGAFRPKPAWRAFVRIAR